MILKNEGNVVLMGGGDWWGGCWAGGDGAAGGGGEIIVGTVPYHKKASNKQCSSYHCEKCALLAS